MTDTIRFLGFAGSLRKASYNKALLRAAGELLPDLTTLELFDLEGIPPYNMDLEPQFPARAKEFKERIRAADALVIATPEHNYSVPGVLKNAIDWASRPFEENPFNGKPAAIMGASIGSQGTSRAQYHFRQVGLGLGLHLLNGPEVMVPLAQKKIDENGKLTDEKTKEKIKAMLQALVEWTRRLREK